MRAEGRKQKAEGVRSGDGAHGSASGPRLDRRLPLFLLSAFCFLLFPTVAQACPVCYGTPSNGQADAGTNNAILFLLATVILVQAGFVALFVSFWRRTRALQRRRDELRVIQGGLFGSAGPGKHQEATHA